MNPSIHPSIHMYGNIHVRTYIACAASAFAAAARRPLLMSVLMSDRVHVVMSVLMSDRVHVVVYLHSGVGLLVANCRMLGVEIDTSCIPVHTLTLSPSVGLCLCLCLSVCLAFSLPPPPAPPTPSVCLTVSVSLCLSLSLSGADATPRFPTRAAVRGSLHDLSAEPDQHQREHGQYITVHTAPPQARRFKRLEAP